jgi:hypothetical protein
VASYRADIEIGVRGARELEQLRSNINKTAQAVDSLNDVVSARGSLVQNIQNYTNNLSKAARSLELVSAGTVAETKAVREYVRALGEANTARARQNSLVAQEIANQRRTSPGTAPYGQQGPALPPALVRSQQIRQSWSAFLSEAEQTAKELSATSKSAKLNLKTNWGKFFSDATDAAKDLQTSALARTVNVKASWSKFFEEAQGVAIDLIKQTQQASAAIRNAEGAASAAARQRLAEEANRRQRIRDAGFGVQGPAAPPQQKQQEITRAENNQKRLNNLLASAQVIEQRILQYKRAGINVSEQEAQVKRVISSIQENTNTSTKQYLSAVDDILNTLRNELKVRKAIDQTAKSTAQTVKNTAAQVKQDRTPVQKPDNQNREALSNAIIGGAFPLLFGQGLGAAIGGGAGGAIGGALGGSFGFGLSLVGTALGGAFDNAANSARDFAKALRGSGDAAQVLEGLLGGLNPQTRTLISNLQSSGQTARAAQVAFNELSSVIGRENTKALQDAGNGWDNFGKQVKTTLTLITAEVIKTFKEIERTNPQKGGFSIASFIGQIALQGEKRQQAAAITPEAAQRAAGLQQETDQLRTQAVLTTLSAKNNLDLFVYTSQRLAQQERISREAEIEYKFVQGQISGKERLILLDQSRLKTQIDLNAIERQRIEELQRRQEEAARRAEEAARKQEQTVKNILGLQIELSQVTLESADVDVTRTTTTQGQLAGLKESLRQQQERLNVEARILDLQLDQKLLSADISAKEKELLTSIYYQQRANLEGQAQAKARLLQLDIARLETARALAATEGPRQLQDIGQQRGGQLGRIQAQLANPLGGDTLEQLNQQLDQSARRYETLVPLERQLADLQIERNAVASSASSEELGLLDSRITSTLSAIQLEQQYLSQIELSEQALLRQQQFMGRYGQLIQGVSNQIAGLMTTNLSEIIRGTKTAQQVFAEFLDAVGNALLQTAQQMIAQYIAIGIARIFAGLGGGGGGADMSKSGITEATLAPMRQYSMEGPLTGMAGGIGLANGGPVSVGQPYVVGERGPELFLPSTGGNVMSNNDLRSAMGSSSTGGGTPVLNMSFQTTNIGGVEYVSRDQLEQAMAATRRQAASDGAKRGMTMTLDKLQQSPGTRSRVGLR